MYLTKADLVASLYPEITARIARFSDEFVLMHLFTAEAEIETHLSLLYNIRPELNKTPTGGPLTPGQVAPPAGWPDTRNKLLVQIGRSIAIYYMHQNQETIPDKIQKAYDRACELLRMLATGKIRLPGIDAAIITPQTIATGQIAFGTNLRRASLY